MYKQQEHAARRMIIKSTILSDCMHHIMGSDSMQRSHTMESDYMQGSEAMEFDYVHAVFTSCMSSMATYREQRGV
jgi:hypothetical protein